MIIKKCADGLADMLGRKGRFMYLANFNSTRVNQFLHDTQIFQETMEMLDSFSEQGNMPERNYCINSEHPAVVYSDYFADMTFSRG